MNLENTKTKKILEAKRISFSYGDKEILKNISFSLHRDEIIGIAGESGSGKTTLLKLLAGLLSPQKGEMLFHGERMMDPKEKLIKGEEQIKLVNQDFDLMPYISVDQNILRNSLSQSDSARKRILGEYHRKLALGNIKNQKAKKTSGGQMQRVAMATALSTKPEILLLDEPFSNLDYSLKNGIIEMLQSDWKPKGMILVAHEPNDILQLSDRIFIMEKGKIIQKGKPQEVYQNPKNQYAALTLGPINSIKPSEAFELGIEVNDSKKKTIFLRPNQIKIQKKEGLCAKVIGSRFNGAYYLLDCYIEKWNKVLIVQAEKNPGTEVIINLGRK